MSSFAESPNASGSSSRFESPNIDTLKRKGKRRMVNLVNPASADDFSLEDPSLPSLQSIIPLRTQAESTNLSTSPASAPPARYLRETTPVNQIGRDEDLGLSTMNRIQDSTNSTNGFGMGKDRFGGVGASTVKGILRPQGTPGSGNGVRFGQKNRFRVITPNNSVTTYGTPPRPAPASPKASAPTPTNPQTPPPSFFSSLMSVASIASPLRASFGSLAPPPLPAMPVAEDKDEHDEENDGEVEEEGEDQIEQSWEVPGEEGEVSLLGSSTGDVTHSYEDEQEEEDEELQVPATPWSGVPEVHSSPLSLPSAADNSKDISIQDLSAGGIVISADPSISSTDIDNNRPTDTQVYAHDIAPTPPQKVTTRNGRYSLNTHVRNTSTDSASLFTHRTHGMDAQDTPWGADDVSNLLSTTFDGMSMGMSMLNTMGMESITASDALRPPIAKEMGSAEHGGSIYDIVSKGDEQEDGEMDISSFGLHVGSEDDPTIRRRLSCLGASSGETARYSHSTIQRPAGRQSISPVKNQSSSPTRPAGLVSDDRNPFAPTIRPTNSTSPDINTHGSLINVPGSDKKGRRSLSPVKPKRHSSSPDKSSPNSFSSNLPRSRSVSPVKPGASGLSPLPVTDSPDKDITHSPSISLPTWIKSTNTRASVEKDSKADSPASAATTPSSAKNINGRFASIFADMSAEQAGLQWPLTRSTHLNAHVGSLRSGTEAAGAGAGANADTDMSFSPLAVKSAQATCSKSRDSSSASTPMSLLVETPNDRQGTGGGDKTAFFTPLATPCPPRSRQTSSSLGASLSTLDLATTPPKVEMLPTLSGTEPGDVDLSAPTLAVYDAHASHALALRQQVELYRNLAGKLQEEVEERDRALGSLKVRLVQSEIRVVRARDEIRSRSREGSLDLVQSAHGRPGSVETKDQTQAGALNDDLAKQIQDQRDEFATLQSQRDAEVSRVREREEAAREREIALHSELQHLRHRLAEMMDAQTRRDEHELERTAREEDERSKQDQERIRDLEIRLQAASGDLNIAQRAQSEAEDAGQALREEKVELVRERGEMRAELKELERELQVALEQQARLQLGQAEITERMGGAEQRAQQAEEREEAMRVELDKERQASNDLERIANELKLALAEAQQQVRRLRNESSSKDLDISTLTRRKAELKEDREMLNIALDSKQQEVELLKRKLARATSNQTAVPGRSSTAHLPSGVIAGTGAGSSAGTGTGTGAANSALGESQSINIGTDSLATPVPMSMLVSGSAHKMTLPVFPQTPSVQPGNRQVRHGVQLYASTQLKDRVLRRPGDGDVEASVRVRGRGQGQKRESVRVPA